jgi:hypothetical protein
VGTRKPDGYRFGQNFKSVMDTSFLMDINIFHGYGFEIAKPDGFVPVAISGLVAGCLPVKGPCGKLTTAKEPPGESDERSNPTERTVLGRRRLVPSAGPVRRLVPISPPARRALLPPWRRCGSRPPGSRTRSLGRSVARLSSSRKSRSI